MPCRIEKEERLEEVAPALADPAVTGFGLHGIPSLEL